MGNERNGSGRSVVSGQIDTDKISSAHSTVKEIVKHFNKVSENVPIITNQIKDNWVGQGRNEFEAQYNILIRKIEDFGDTLKDIYEALVQAEVDYETEDNDIKQDIHAAMGK